MNIILYHVFGIFIYFKSHNKHSSLGVLLFSFCTTISIAIVTTISLYICIEILIKFFFIYFLFYLLFRSMNEDIREEEILMHKIMQTG